MNTREPFLIAQCKVCLLENKLTCVDMEVVLQPKFIELLCLLASRYPDAITRDELIEKVWDGNHFVGEKALTNAIWHLRKSFKELDPSQSYIETLRKTGYRLMVSPTVTPSVEVKGERTKKVQVFKTKPVYVIALAILIMVALSLYILHSWRTSIPAVQPANLSGFIEPVTSSPGRELFPTISNDNHFMVYSWRRPGRPTNLYLRDLFSPEQGVKALTNTEFVEGRAVFSRDLQRLYYYRRLNNQQCEIVEHIIRSAEIKVLANCPTSFATDLDVNSQGTELVFISEVRNVSGKHTVLNILDLTAAKPTTRQIPCLDMCNTYDESVAFSPDATQLVVSRHLPNGNEELYLISVASGEAQPLTSGFIDIRGVDWHPFKNQVVFSGVKLGERRGYVFNLDRGTLTDTKIKGLSYPEYATDGSLYFHQWHIDSALMRIETNKSLVSSPFPILSMHFNMRFADYNRTRNKIAFVSNESGNHELWIANPDGTNREQLSNLQASIYNPIWSYDGRYIAYTAHVDDENKLFIYDFKKLSSTVFATGFKFHGKPAWGADSQSLLVSDKTYVYRFNLEGENLGKAIEQPAYYAFETEQQDVVFANQDASKLLIKDHITGIESVLVADINLSNRFAWYYVHARDGLSEKIFYFNVNQGDYRLSFYDLATKQHQDVMRLPERAFSRSSGLTFIPNLDWLVYTAYKSPQIDIKRIKAQDLPE
ncbi:winged helix-turn-helix domain-containing protein [Pseudoalteromonas shioyasakiensis]|uniref:winged helix-turn-helix domain-containing protein n=1 Tax=Pseudoalteromonas shioyasakiensis TaxID=1190813 RepID=UPI0021173520|nr:winged helix-turn-helix domain-containing protein [Pseudoalteromonas shioyasakiensis]MCQ8879540.1 winged helix-turn-helix domain-containing protein [Pseudoalteromonas shioyasakiensis]